MSRTTLRTPSREPVALILARSGADRRVLSDFLSGRGCQVKTVGSPRDALMMMRVFPPDVVIVDVTGLGSYIDNLMTWIRHREESADVQVILIDGADTIEGDAGARAIGARCVLAKPFAPDVLVDHVTAAVTARALLDRAEVNRPRGIRRLRAAARRPVLV